MQNEPQEFELLVGSYEFTVSLLNSILMVKSYSQGLNKLYEMELTDTTLTADLKILFGRCTIAFTALKKCCLADKNNTIFSDQGILIVKYTRNIEGAEVKNDLIFAMRQVTLDETQRLRLKIVKFQKQIQHYERQFGKMMKQNKDLKQAMIKQTNTNKTLIDKLEKSIKDLTAKHENDIKAAKVDTAALTTRHDNEIKAAKDTATALATRHDKDISDMKVKYDNQIKAVKDMVIALTTRHDNQIKTGKDITAALTTRHDKEMTEMKVKHDNQAKALKDLATRHDKEISDMKVRYDNEVKAVKDTTAALTTRHDNQIKATKDTTAALATRHDKDISDMKVKYDNQIKAVKDAAVALTTRHDNQIKAGKDITAALTTRHDKEIADMKTKYDNEIKTTKQTVSALTTRHDNQIKALTTRHDNQIKAAKDLTAALTTRHDNEIKAIKDSVTALTTRHNTEVKEAKDATTALKQFTNKQLGNIKDSSTKLNGRVDLLKDANTQISKHDKFIDQLIKSDLYTKIPFQADAACPHFGKFAVANNQINANKTGNSWYPLFANTKAIGKVFYEVTLTTIGNRHLLLGVASSDVKAVENTYSNINSLFLNIAGNSSVHIEAKNIALNLQLNNGNKIQVRIDTNVGTVEWVLVDPFLRIAKLSIPAALKAKELFPVVLMHSISTDKITMS